MSNHHTPGPWAIHPFCNDGLTINPEGAPPYTYWKFAIGRGEKLIGEAAGNTNGNGGYPKVENREEVLANARLIAAAPEMFELMERIVSNDPPIEPYKLRIRAREIVKKVNKDV